MLEPSALNGVGCKTILTKRSPTSRYFTKRETPDIRNPKMNRALRMINSCLSSGEAINISFIYVIVAYKCARTTRRSRPDVGVLWGSSREVVFATLGHACPVSFELQSFFTSTEPVRH